MELEQKLVKVESLIGILFEKYKQNLTKEDRELVDEYLYDQGEYEEAISMLLAGLKYKNISLTEDDQKKVNEIYSLMGIAKD